VAITVLTDGSITSDSRVLSFTIPTLAVGDVAVLSATTWDAGVTLPNPSGTGLAFGASLVNPGTGSHDKMYIWAMKATSGGSSVVVTVGAPSGASMHTGVLLVFPAADGYDLAGTPNVLGPASSAQSGSLTGTSGNYYVVSVGDWNGSSGASRAWLASATEDLYAFSSGTNTQYFAHGVLTGASTTVGLSAPSIPAGDASIGAIEVLKTAGGSAAVDASPMLRPGFMSGTAFPSFMDAPNIAGWSPFGLGYDLGSSGPQAYTSPLTGTVGFTGADATLTSKGLTAATVGFTGSLTKRLARSLAATVSFTGAHATAAVHNFTQALTATLSFTGAQSRRVGKGIAAALSFTGAQSRATAASKSATVSFTGAQTRRVSSGLSATVSFTGAQVRRVGHGMAATVSFTGSFATAAVHFFTQTFTATVGFTGSLATAAVHVFTKALTATVGFTGSVTRRTARSVSATVGLTAGALTRRIGSGQSATVGFTGSIRRAIGHRLSAAVGFVGNLLGQGSGAATTDPNPQTASFTEHATATFIERNTDTFIEHATATSRSNR
jgi:hypothetical protein